MSAESGNTADGEISNRDKLLKRVGNLDFVIVEEVGMASPEALAWLENLFQARRQVGSVNVVCGNDIYQLPQLSRLKNDGDAKADELNK